MTKIVNKLITRNEIIKIWTGLNVPICPACCSVLIKEFEKNEYACPNHLCMIDKIILKEK